VTTPQNLFSSALSFAVELHRNQHRKGTEIPYLSHLLAVASLVMEDGGGEEEAIAALLHDAVEDQGDTFPGGREGLRDRIRTDFGERVLAIVNACTHDEGHAKGRALTPEAEATAWKRRKEEYLAHLRSVTDPAVLRVSCADKLHNARCVLADYQRIGDSVWQRFRTKNAADQLWYYKELSQVFSEKNVGRLPRELTSVVHQLEAS
jgi:(p)ppGpp synthase/HD superfamily hydrolase